jgi:hypothetical protein
MMADEEGAPAEQAEWRAVLREASSSFLRDHGRGLLLSGVPVVLRNAGIDIGQLLGRQKLAPFLATFGPPEIQLIRSEENPALWAILPGDAEIAPPLSRYFPQPKPEDAKATPPRFHPAVWRCFVTNLEPGNQRWLNLSGTPFFFDRVEGEPVDGAVEVDREFVRTDSLFKSNDAIAASIEQWAAKHGIDSAKLVVSENREVSHGKGKEAVLTSFLSSLTRDEMVRISLPADVVARFLGIK